jgi:outer membrane protein OmpA-like peptidoglycan-associated protein
MRASLTLDFGATVSLALATPAFVAPAHADPAYTPDQIIGFFAKEKAAADAYKAGKSRSICIGTAADCRKQKAEAAPPQQAHFDLLVNFEFNSDQLTQAAKDNLNQFAKALQDPRLKGEDFEIDGHTDAVGAEVYNQDLSERRAHAVVSYLATQGVDTSTLTAKGFGKTKPRVANPYSAENRRVETHLEE